MTDGGPAFPLPYQPIGGYVDWNASGGMSLRDYFAAQALPITFSEDPTLPTILNALEMTQNEYVAAGYPFERFAAMKAYKVADAMLAAREVQT